MSSLSTITPSFQIKSLTQEGFFSGYASVFNVVDLQKDIVMPGAFSHTLKKCTEKQKWPFLLWQHHLSEPIGFWKNIREDYHGLFVEGQLLLTLKRGYEAYLLMQSGVLEGLSIGFVPIVARRNAKARTRSIFQVDLIEISLVTLPANPEACLRQVKTISSLTQGTSR